MAKELIKETKYLKGFYESKEKLLTFEWLANTEEMEADVISEVVKEYKPKLGISEMTNFFYTIDPDIQKEVDEKNASIFKETGLEKLAIVVDRGSDAEDFEFDFERMSIEQIAQEEHHVQVQTHVFPSEKIARKWLFS